MVDLNENVVSAGSKESCAYREGEQHFPLIVDLSKNHVEEKNSQTSKQESLTIVDTCEVISATVGEEVVIGVNQNSMKTASDSLENFLASTRPSLARNRRKNVKAKRNRPDVIVTS